MQDRIEKQVELAAPIARVWRALSDHREFGQWFRAETSGPFFPGAVVGCRCLYPGLEHLTWEMTIQVMEQEALLVFSWPAYYGEDVQADTTQDPHLRVEFRLEATATGTRLTIIESGFSALPPDRAPAAFRLDESGWNEQVKNIETHVYG